MAQAYGLRLSIEAAGLISSVAIFIATAVASFIGLYTDDINGDQLDDPMSEDNPQFRWLVKALSDIKVKHAEEPKVLVITLQLSKLTGEFFAVLRSGESGTGTPRIADTLALDLATKRIA